MSFKTCILILKVSKSANILFEIQKENICIKYYYNWIKNVDIEED